MGIKRREKRSKKPEGTPPSATAKNISDTPPLVKWPKPKEPGPRSRYSE